MTPKYYIENVVKQKEELLFVGDELFINTKKRQDSKHTFASYNVSQWTKKSREKSLKKSSSLEVLEQIFNPYLDLKLPLERFTQQSKEDKDLMPICLIESG